MLKEKEILNFHIPRWQELPEIDLYLDQVVTFIDKYLSDYLKNDYKKSDNSDENRILTKTMINNYVKQKVMEPPVKKKYNRSNIAYLFVICILKQVYSISDIDSLIKLALKNSPINKAYDSFCDALETAIINTFTGQRSFTLKATSDETYLLFNVAQTFASKLYVEQVYLSKQSPIETVSNSNTENK